jgi:hypothetical protein
VPRPKVDGLGDEHERATHIAGWGDGMVNAEIRSSLAQCITGMAGPFIPFSNPSLSMPLRSTVSACDTLQQPHCAHNRIGAIEAPLVAVPAQPGEVFTVYRVRAGQ